MLTNVYQRGFIVVRKSFLYASLLGISMASAQKNVSSFDVPFYCTKI